MPNSWVLILSSTEPPQDCSKVKIMLVSSCKTCIARENVLDDTSTVPLPRGVSAWSTRRSTYNLIQHSCWVSAIEEAQALRRLVYALSGDRDRWSAVFLSLKCSVPRPRKVWFENQPAAAMYHNICSTFPTGGSNELLLVGNKMQEFPAKQNP